MERTSNKGVTNLSLTEYRRVYQEGVDACRDGLTLHDAPYLDDESGYRRAWCDGYLDARCPIGVDDKT